MSDSFETARAALTQARAVGSSTVTIDAAVLETVLASASTVREEMFWRLTEHNDHEGETWHFYVRFKGNEEALDFLDDVMQDFCDPGIYHDEPILLSVATIERLPDDTSYMGTHNIIDGVLDLGRLKAANWEDGDPLYKGGLYNFVVKAGGA